MAEIDRTFKGAVKEIHRLCQVINDLEQENRFLTEQLLAVAKERSALRREVERLTEYGLSLEKA